jgi:hypothetical protein
MHCFTIRTATRGALVIATMLALAPLTALAADDTQPNWDLDAGALMRAQTLNNVGKLEGAISSTDKFARGMTAYLGCEKVTAAAMIRLSYRDDLAYVLYRTRDKAMLAQVTSDNDGNVNPNYLSTVTPAEWDSLFDKLRAYKQPRPTPMTRKNPSWPFGYRGVLHFYENGVSHTALIAANDIQAVNNPNVVDDFFCGKIFGGMHCHPGPKMHDGWLIEALYRMKTSKTGWFQSKELPWKIHEALLSCGQASEGN